MPRNLRLATVSTVLAALVGCGGEAAAPAPPPTATAPPPATETTKLRAASAVGYDGDALQRSVDRVRAIGADEAKRTEEAAAAAGTSP